MAIEEIDVDQLALRLESGAVLVDVREPDEVAQARVPGVLPIPLGEIEQRASEIPDSEELYVICRSGGRSAKACEILGVAGRKAVNVAGGTLAWIDSGRTTESDA